MKKIGLILGGIFLTLLVILIAVPFFVDVDKYRPQIVEAANHQIQGELKLGKLKLSLLGGIKVHAEGIEISVKGYQRPLLNTDQFHLEIPFMAILTGHPRIVAVLTAPKILIEKPLNGKMNAMELMKPAAASSAATAPAPVNPSAAPGASKSGAAPQVPAILAAASFGLRIEKGAMNYEDAVSKSKYAVNGLDLSVKDLGLMSTMSLDFTAPLQGSSPTMSFGGVATGSGSLTPILSGGAVKSASGSFAIDAGGLEFTVLPSLVTKTKAMPLSAKIVFEGSEKDILFKTLEFKLFDYAISGKGLVITQPEASVRLELNSNEIGLESLHDLVPMVKAYDLKGKIGLNTKIEASAASLKANGNFKLSNGSVSMPGILKAPLQIAMEAGFTENSLNILKSEVHGPDSDLALSGTVRDFMAPQFNISLNGKAWNVDKTLVLPAPGAAPAKTAMLWGENEALAAPASVNPMLEMAKNPILMKANGNLSANLGSLTAYEAKIEDIVIKAQLASLVLHLNQASFKSFGGTISSTGEFDLKSPGLTYKSSGKVAGISAKDAFANYFPRFKNTLDGIADADWNVSGSAFPDTARLKLLKGTAKISARDGHLRTIDFKDTIQGAIAKVPFLKNAKTPNVEEGFKSFRADMNFSDGITKIDPLYMLGQGKGLEIKGKSTIQESFEQESFMDIYDPNNILPQELHSAGKPALALRMTGPLTGPKVDYDYMVKKLAGSAGKNMIQQQIGKFLGKPAGGDGGNSNPAQDAAKSIGDALKKKFHF